DEGVYVLTAQVEDLAGNTAVLAMSVRVFLEATQVSLLGSDFSSFATCMDDAGCGDQAICEPVGGTGRCVHPWDGGTQKINVGSQPADYFSSLEAPLRLCSSHAGLLAAGAPLCGTTIGSEKFREIKSVPHGGGAAVVTFTPAQLAALPSGYHHVVAEALADDGTWIRSVDTPNFTQQNRHYWLDVMPPSVTGVSFPTDTQAPIGTLGLAERTGAPAIFPVQVTLAAAETGILEVWGNGLLLATEPLAGSTVTLDLALVQGVNLLQVLAFDKVGNGSAPFGLSVTVDTVPPVMTFVQPVGSPQVAGSSPDVILLASAVDGNDLSLERFTDGAWGLLGTAAPGMTGLTTFSGALAQDGTWVLRGRAQDDAGNETSIFTVPGTIVVDRTPPTGSLTAPAAAASLEDDDDAAPAAPGFQIQVAFDLADAATWEVRLAECPDATFTGCGTAVLKASGSLPGPAPATVDTTVTLGAVDQPVEHRQLRVKIADGVGNALQLAANLTITLTACQVDFADFPDTGWYNTTSCAVPGQGCASITPVLTAVFTAGCGTVDAVRLYHDAAVQATLPVLAGSQVAFPLSLSHGTMATFEARLVAAGVETGDTSGERDVQVDLTLPAVAFADPPAGTVVLAMADD
ncbi:MAG: hypothetical protein FJ098_15050, partial [Deltaproteobacteria bacterium]|nr:hypothetical protein [Deltaproteobacteria bacterium]